MGGFITISRGTRRCRQMIDVPVSASRCAHHHHTSRPEAVEYPVKEDGSEKLSDFGIAKHLEARSPAD